MMPGMMQPGMMPGMMPGMGGMGAMGVMGNPMAMVGLMQAMMARQAEGRAQSKTTIQEADKGKRPSAPGVDYVDAAAGGEYHGIRPEEHQGVVEGGRRLPVTAHVGDWLCPITRCGTHNFASRTTCFKCGTARATGGSGADRGQTITVSVKPAGGARRQDGDFVVGQGFAGDQNPSKGVHNYGYRSY